MSALRALIEEYKVIKESSPAIDYLLACAANELESLQADSKRMDYLENELAAEKISSAPTSLFRLNKQITRSAIDQAMASIVIDEVAICSEPPKLFDIIVMNDPF